MNEIKYTPAVLFVEARNIVDSFCFRSLSLGENIPVSLFSEVTFFLLFLQYNVSRDKLKLRLVSVSGMSFINSRNRHFK